MHINDSQNCFVCWLGLTWEGEDIFSESCTRVGLGLVWECWGYVFELFSCAF